MKWIKLNESALNLGPIQTKKYGSYNSIDWLNGKIKAYITEVYQPYGFVYGVNKDLNIDGYIINSEYISKMVNNYTVFIAIIKANFLRTEEAFYHYMTNNLEAIYNWKGRYFKRITLPILIRTSKRGNEGETKSLEFFKRALKEKKGISIEFIQPTVEEDISGIDGKFIWQGKEVTIQVKPYDTATISASTRKVKIHSQGSLSLSTDYLIVYRGQSFIVVQGRDVTIEGNHFTFQEDKIVARQQ
jgi:hypothetical protein